MNSTLIDTHCHLDAEAFQQDIEDVVHRAEDAGVTRMMTIGIDAATSQAAVELADRFESVWAVVGIQPNYAHEVKPNDWEKIVELTAHDRVVGIGETGLDRYWDYAPIDLQVEYFHRHLQLARRINLPFVVHCRDAESDVLDVLRDDIRNGPLNGIMHSFCGDEDMAAECVAMGMYISFAGMVTFRKNDDMRTVAANVPLDRLLIETDAPYLAPHPNRGKRNEPAWVTHTAECLAAIHDVTVEDLAQSTSQNAERVFGLTW